MFSKAATQCAILGVLLATPAISSNVRAQDVLTLDEALERAGVSAPALAEADAEIAVAQGEAQQAAYGPNPEVSADVENIAGSGAFQGLRSTEATLTLSQRLELGGKRSARRRAAVARINVAELSAELARAELGLAIRERYLAAVAAEAGVVLAQNVVDRSRELARIAGELVDAGREPPLRGLRANADLGEAEANLAAKQADSLEARLALAALLGGDGKPPAIPSTFPQIDAPMISPNAVDALELRVAEAERAAASAAVRREESVAVPDLTVSAGVRRFEESNDQAFVVGASIPLPFRDRNRGNIAAAQAQVTAAAAREARARAEYVQRAGSAAAQYRAAQSRVETLTQISIPQAEEALRLARIGYRYGRFTLIEVLDAADARDAAQRALIEAQTALGLAASQLIRLSATSEIVR